MQNVPNQQIILKLAASVRVKMQHLFPRIVYLWGFSRWRSCSVAWS